MDSVSSHVGEYISDDYKSNPVPKKYQGIMSKQWQWKNNDGTSGQVLTTDGNGLLTWTTNGSGTLTWEEATGQAIIDGGNFDTSASLVSTTTTYDGGTFT